MTPSSFLNSVRIAFALPNAYSSIAVLTQSLVIVYGSFEQNELAIITRVTAKRTPMRLLVLFTLMRPSSSNQEHMSHNPCRLF